MGIEWEKHGELTWNHLAPDGTCHHPCQVTRPLKGVQGIDPTLVSATLGQQLPQTAEASKH
jgi:hypothetical protein